MSQITYRAEYSGHVDGEKVAWTYRAYNEEGAPYVLALGPNTIVQAPTEFLDGVPDEELDRQNAICWVENLTELAQKAQAYDEIAAAVEKANRPLNLDEIHDYVAEDDDEDDLTMVASLWLPSDGTHDAFVVDELTDAENDTEWVDCDGEHYKNIDGEWYYAYEDNSGGLEPWNLVTSYPYGNLLTEFGPYTAVDA